MRRVICSLSMSWVIGAGLTAAPVLGQSDTGKTSSAPIIMQTYRAQGEVAAATQLLQLLTDSSDVYTFEFEHLRFVAEWLGSEDRRDEKVALLRRMTEEFPESPVPWSDLGTEYLLSGERVAAESCLVRAQALAPESDFVAWQLANIEELHASAQKQQALKSRYQPGECTGIDAPYLGEEPPDHTAKVFAPGIVCGAANEFAIAFSPDGREIYLSRSGVGIMVCRWTAEGWTAPAKVDFFPTDYFCDEAGLSPDGQWIYFNARPVSRGERCIYRARRTANGWGEPESLFVGMYPTVTAKGTVYYTEVLGRPDYGVLAKRQTTGAGFSEPIVLGGGTNSERLDAHPFVTSDGKLLLFDSNRSGRNELFACFRRADGEWGEAIALNERLGIPRTAGQCALSPDGRYLFFSLNDDMYWVSAAFLDELRKQE